MERKFTIARLHHILERALKHDISHLIGIVLPTVICSLLTDLDRLYSSRGCSGIREHLRLDTSIKGAEQECRSVNCLADCKMSMIREDHSFAVS
jgi:hypothetical protein